jgi:hypothetical protein
MLQNGEDGHKPLPRFACRTAVHIFEPTNLQVHSSDFELISDVSGATKWAMSV